MEKTSLPISLDRAKQIERDEFFKAGGTYRSQMNPSNSKIEGTNIKKNKNLRELYSFRSHNHHKTALVGKTPYQIYD